MHLLSETNVRDKTVFLRADLDVPVVNGEIEDDSRLVSAIPTIEYLLRQNAKIVIGGHLGRPNGIDKNLSLEPIAKWFGIKYKVLSIKQGARGEFAGWEIGENIFLLENLRFYEGEEKNDPEFSKKLAGLADIYVNEAFANSHRNHASVAGVPKYLPHCAGLHLQQEIEVLSKVLENPERPLVVVIGGAKLETKIPLVESMHRIADYVLVGGKLANETRTLIKMQHEKLEGRKSALLIADLNADQTDVTEKSVENFLQIIGLAKTVVWNGPIGKISEDKAEMAESEIGSRKLAEGLVKSSAYIVIGGGDTVGFLGKACFLDNFACMPKSRCLLSTGGGAMLSFLSGEKLPGIEALS